MVAGVKRETKVAQLRNMMRFDRAGSVIVRVLDSDFRLIGPSGICPCQIPG